MGFPPEEQVPCGQPYPVLDPIAGSQSPVADEHLGGGYVDLNCLLWEEWRLIPSVHSKGESPVAEQGRVFPAYSTQTSCWLQVVGLLATRHQNVISMS